MSKRPIPSNDAPPTKRSRKLGKLAGFRLARHDPPTLEALGSSSFGSSYKPSLFITVNQPDERQCTESVEGPEQITKPKRKRHTKNVDRLNEWLNFRATFLDEALRHDGLGDFIGHTMCSSCGKVPGTIKCKDCQTGRMLKCTECVVASHRTLPLHLIERWNGEFFDKDTLQNLGHRYQLGHSGAPCPCPQPGPKNFVVFDTSGPHFVTIDYCHCSDDPLTNWTQLLREQWFPATLTCPQTVFTFDSLETFHELTLQGKMNLYDYYNTLIRRFDNANIATPIRRYSEIHWVFRMWRNLMALKRAGRGHDWGGIDSTSKGELMVECPACPHPGRNLPDEWKNAGPLLFLYTLFIAVDGNFKLKGKQRHLKDVELMPGWGAYVPEEEYQAHIANYIDQPEVSIVCRYQQKLLTHN
ncbi:hypothetical protein K443DRAFT_117632 [Laccaria amethystina LaAM-08-1]|uniref:CxC2-like cysteine cluster KDZ transposase-associated domain-containing protein n=1 Tax=Laccaria amethystina LaAM-08-1 TaxID=1095629 RepID=A0A0C9WZ54_9AGAR|nr:hypothetical protein K443DRAFT_117632 [Laccaria amethystina LaAM-08-1]